MLKLFLKGCWVITEIAAAVLLGMLGLVLMFALTIGPLMLTFELEQPLYLGLYVITVTLVGLFTED